MKCAKVRPSELHEAVWSESAVGGIQICLTFQSGVISLMIYGKIQYSILDSIVVNSYSYKHRKSTLHWIWVMSTFNTSIVKLNEWIHEVSSTKWHWNS